MESERKIVILASGGGSNARSIIEHFNKLGLSIVGGIISNKKDAGVHQVARDFNIPSYFFDKEDRTSGKMLDEIKHMNPALIVLAGYLLKISASVVQEFPDRIINIHPALLPKFGGKGMYGMNVHQAVIDSGEKESGLTIHFVNENYDEGNIIRQVSCNVAPEDDAVSLQKKVLKLEHEHYPLVIEELLKL